MKSKKSDKEKRENETKDNSILVFTLAASYFVLWYAMRYFVDAYALTELAFITYILSYITLFAIIFAIIHFVLSMVLLQKES